MFAFIKKLFGQQGEPSTREAIEELVTENHEGESNLHEEERQLFVNILKLREMTAEDVMIPRADMVAMPMSANSDDLMALIGKHTYSRLPIFGENLDDIRGFIHVKDAVVSCLLHEKRLTEKLTPILFVPTSMPVVDLLAKMRQETVPIAIVVDEYGGTDGLVTAWDILREIIGDMQKVPESDSSSSAKIVLQSDGSVLADARVEIEELERVIGFKLSNPEIEEEADTIGGLVMYVAGRVPDRKEVITADDGTQFEVVDANPRTVLSVRIYPSTKHSGDRSLDHSTEFPSDV